MNAQLSSMFPYILPVYGQEIDDKIISITANRFKALYGDLIYKLSRHIDILPTSEEYIKPEDLGAAISKITEMIDLSDEFCRVWENDGNLVIMASNEMKSDGMNIFLAQREQGYINPKDFLIEKKQAPGFNDRCVVAMAFQYLLILFEKLLMMARTIEQDEYFELKVTQLFNVVDTTNQLNRFSGAFFNRQNRRRGANERARIKSDIKAIVSKIIAEQNIKHRDTIKNNISATSAQVKKAYEGCTGKPFPFSDKTLEKYIIDAPKA